MNVADSSFYDVIKTVPGNLSGPAPEFPWPEGKKSVLFTAFDIDTESVWLAMDPKNQTRLVTRSYGGYEPRIGVPKILEILKRHEVPATFFVTGWSVETYPEMCETILVAGHEIAHHGYLHFRPEPGNIDLMIEEVDRGIEVMQRVLGIRPKGYRAPGGDSYVEMLQLLRSRGIEYSSSWRDDIRPYRHALPDGAGPIEIPVNFSFDDWNYGMCNRYDSNPLFSRESVLSIWKDEFEQTHEWGGVTTTVFHPQVSGRPMRSRILDQFLAHTRTYDDVWYATGSKIAEHFHANEPV
ncbi:polysaccharide deacetylase family protein [Brucella sp. LJL56]